MRYFLACLLFLFSILFFSQSVWAENSAVMSMPTGGQVNEALDKIVPIRFFPNQPFYFFITVKENISRFFKPSAVKRAGFDLVLSSKRLKESYLMYAQGDYVDSNKALLNYSKRVALLLDQIEKARSQNQELAMFAQKAAEGLNQQDILLRVLRSGQKQKHLDYLNDAISSFEKLAVYTEGLKPGMINRYQLLKDINNKQEASNSANLIPLEINESSATAKPRRIIY